MDANKIDMFMLTNAKMFSSEKIMAIRSQLERLDDSKFPLLQTVSLKDPTTLLIVSLLGGNLGIDRFMLGEVGLGIAKLLTCGGMGIWSIVDWFTIMNRTRDINHQKVAELLVGQ